MTDDIHADAFRLADLFGLCPDCFLSSLLLFKTSMLQFLSLAELAYHTIWQY